MKNSKINWEDIFKPNKYNVNPQDLQVNDIIVKSGLGLMELVQKFDDDSISPMHGKKLFSMKKLFGTTDNTWTLYSSSFTDKLEYVKMATDEDIVEEMIRISCDYDLGDNLHLVLNDDKRSGGVFIYMQGEESNSIYLDQKDAIKLRDSLNRFID